MTSQRRFVCSVYNIIYNLLIFKLIILLFFFHFYSIYRLRPARWAWWLNRSTDMLQSRTRGPVGCTRTSTSHAWCPVFWPRGRWPWSCRFRGSRGPSTGWFPTCDGCHITRHATWLLFSLFRGLRSHLVSGPSAGRYTLLRWRQLRPADSCPCPCPSWLPRLSRSS